VTSSTVRDRWLPIAVLAAVLSLDSADRSTLSAVEAQLEPQLGISVTTFGVLAALTPIVALVAALPLGVLVDRVVRTRLLAICTLLWVAGEVVAAVSPSLGVLAIGRVLGGFVLAGIPAVVSLTGDWFPSGERARVYGYILSGELLGTAVGFLGTGTIGASLGWRWGFAALAALGAVVAVGVWSLTEPGRGDQRDEPGSIASVARRGPLEEELEAEHVAPSPEAVLERDPSDMRVRDVFAYVLRVRSNRILIVVSALTYLFLSGVQTFAVRFGADQYGLVGAGSTMMLVGLGVFAIIGVLVTGWIADRLVAAHRVNARVIVGAGAVITAFVCFLPGTLLTSVAVAAPLLLIGSAALGGSNPPVDAARLDVLHHHAWGRGEALRSVLRLVAYAAAPVAMGALIDAVGSGRAFAVLTASLALGGGIMLLAVRSYTGDVVAASSSPVRAESSARSGSQS
jgi:predicted MFS family arabinose efflux permease